MSSIKETFLQLTKSTIPSGQEKMVESMLPSGYKKDFHGNYYIKIGDSSVMFTSHCDTADPGQPKEVTHVFEGDMIKTDGKTILGADDKAGMAVMFQMIEKKVPGLYYFFLSEEHGCVGSRALNTYLASHKEDPLYKNINKVISLDRRDYDSIITYQVGERCCSDDFANELAVRLNATGLNYRKDTTGSVTDSHQVAEKFPECTNLSVGYFDQHSVRESQNIVFLQKLADACCKIDWETLPVKRDPSKTESLYGRSSYGGYRGTDYRNNWDNQNWWDNNNNKRTTGGYSSSSSSSVGPKQLAKGQEYINDYLGRKKKVADCVWCEHEKVYCPKDEAIWVDYIGFYTCPDYDPSKVKMEPLEDESLGDFKDLVEKDLVSGAKLYRDGKLFGTVDSINASGKVIISTEKGSRFMCPPDKIVSSYKLQVKNAAGGKKLTKSDVKVGLIVAHPSFGQGKIVGFRPDKTIIKINFKEKGEKDVHMEVADLKF